MTGCGITIGSVVVSNVSGIFLRWIKTGNSAQWPMMFVDHLSKPLRYAPHPHLDLEQRVRYGRGCARHCPMPLSHALKTQV